MLYCIGPCAPAPSQCRRFGWREPGGAAVRWALLSGENVKAEETGKSSNARSCP